MTASSGLVVFDTGLRVGLPGGVGRRTVPDTATQVSDQASEVATYPDSFDVMFQMSLVAD